MDNRAEYQIIVNWQDPKETKIGNFDSLVYLDGWIAGSGARLDLSTDFTVSKPYAAKISADIAGNEIIFDDLGSVWDSFVFGSDSSPPVGLAARKVLTGLEIGTSYTAFCWAYIPSGARHLRLTVSGADYDTTTVAFDTWLYLETQWTAAASSIDIELHAVFTEGTISKASYFDDTRYKVAGEDITCLVYNQSSSIDTLEGRDTPRALSKSATSETAFQFTNQDRLYSPNNPLSVLGSNSATNTPIQIRAIYEGRYYLLYNGFVDDYIIEQLQPDYSTVNITGIDTLGKLAATNISTGLFQNLRTGEAIGKILDEIGWPEGKRKLDYGATVIDWWWEDETNALDAVNALIAAEGMPAIVYVDDVGDFVFKDRHHRYISTFSTRSVAHFSECDSTPAP